MLSTTTVTTIFSGGVTSLVDIWTAFLPLLIPVAISAAVLFGGIHFLKGLGHKK